MDMWCYTLICVLSGFCVGGIFGIVVGSIVEEAKSTKEDERWTHSNIRR